MNHKIRFKLYFLIFILIFLVLLSCAFHQSVNQDFELKNISNIAFDFSSYINNCIAIYGDTRNGYDIHKRIVKLIAKFNPLAVFNTGDLVHNGNNKNQWKQFDNITKNLRALFPYYPVAGNHENEAKYFYERFNFNNGKGWYKIVVKDYLFVLLDSNVKMDKNSEQYSWLVNVLENSIDKQSKKSRYKQVVLLFHHPLFSTGRHPEDEKKLKPILLPLIEKYGIKIVFSGHDHCYEKSKYKNTYFITTGGGGAPLYNQTRNSKYSLKYLPVYHFVIMQDIGDKTILKVFDINLNIIDEIEIKNCKVAVNIK